MSLNRLWTTAEGMRGKKLAPQQRDNFPLFQSAKDSAFSPWFEISGLIEIL